MTVRFDPSAPYEVEEADVVYARPEGKDLLARVYRPKGAPAAPLMGLVDAHGGAWNRLDRTIGVHHGRGLAAAGVVVASWTSGRGRTTSIRRRAPTWRRGCGGCALTPAASASIPHASGSSASRAADISRSSSGCGRESPPMPEFPSSCLTDHSARARATTPSSSSSSSIRSPILSRAIATRSDARRSRPSRPRLRREPARLLPSRLFHRRGRHGGRQRHPHRELGRGARLPPVWLAHPELDDNVPSEITEAFVAAYAKAGGRIERVHFPGARHGFMQQAGPATDKCIALMRNFIGSR